MINFILGAAFSGILLLTLYFTQSGKKKMIDYRKKDHLQRLLSQKDFEFLLIDIRDEDAFKKSHLPYAENIQFNSLISSLPVENMFLNIIVYGDSKKLSQQAAAYLSERGYFNVTDFGSINKWKGSLVSHEYIGDNCIENSKKGRENLPV